MFKKLISLSLIALMLFSFVANASAFDIKFDNRGGYIYCNVVDLFDFNGKNIFHEKNTKALGEDSYVVITKDKIAEAAYMRVSSSYENIVAPSIGTHEIWLSGSWKKNNPNKMGFKSTVSGIAITVQGNGYSVTANGDWRFDEEKIIKYTI